MIKCFILLVTSFTFIVTSAHSQSSWFWLNPLPQGNDLNAIKFADSQTGIAVGNLGTILKSTNGGNNWNLIYTGYQNSFYSLAFIDANTGFIAGADGLILKTTNKGDSWDQISSGTTDSLNSIIFIDAYTGYIAGRNGKILKTTDSGNNWIEQNSGLSSDLNSIYFLNSNTGYACGSAGKVIRTTNAGNNWNIILSNTDNRIYKAVVFLNENTGFAGGGGIGSRVLVKTTNGGNTWTNIFTIPATYINEIQFMNQLTGYLCSSINSISKTTNGGNTWDAYLVNSNFRSFNAISFSDEMNGFVAGSLGAIAKTQNGGVNWNMNVPFGINGTFEYVSFPSSGIGYIYRSDYNDDSSNIYKTLNGGINWIRIYNASFYFNKFNFIDVFTGYGIKNQPGFNHTLIKSIDGGYTWNQLTIPLNYIYNYEFIDANTGFIDGSVGFQMGSIYRTTNGGINWSPPLLSNWSVSLINFISPETGFCYSRSGLFDTAKIYKTTNAGDNWNYVSTPNLGPNTYISLSPYFINENVGISSALDMTDTVHNDHCVYKTTNTGLNWNRVYESKTFIKTGYNFVTLDMGFFIDSSGIILFTTNQGDNWSKVKISDEEINAGDFVDEYTGYIVGNDGFIKKTTNGGLIAIENVSSSIPDNFMLEQNYPNPFNPVTMIKYRIHSSANVKIVVYNILGKKVSELINEKQNAGSYEVEFNGNNLPSGIYFYELRAGDFIETRKMVLLK